MYPRTMNFVISKIPPALHACIAAQLIIILRGVTTAIFFGLEGIKTMDIHYLSQKIIIS